MGKHHLLVFLPWLSTSDCPSPSLQGTAYLTTSLIATAERPPACSPPQPGPETCARDLPDGRFSHVTLWHPQHSYLTVFPHFSSSPTGEDPHAACISNQLSRYFYPISWTKSGEYHYLFFPLAKTNKQKKKQSACLLPQDMAHSERITKDSDGSLGRGEDYWHFHFF